MDKFQKLRKLAEHVVSKRPVSEHPFHNGEVDQLLHELCVHQVELEIQNETLQKTQIELETECVKYSDLFDFAPVGYLTTDRLDRILEINLVAAGFLGVERKYLYQKLFPRYLAGDSTELFHRHKNAIFKSRERQAVDIGLRKKDGRLLFVHMESEAIRNPEGKPVGMRTAMTDITERKQMENEIQKLNDTLSQQVKNLEIATEYAKNMASDADNASRAKSDFLTVMSHDLRTPLNSILGYAQILDRDRSLPDRYNEAVSVIMKSGKHLLTLIEELLDLSKIETGNMKYEPSVFNLSGFLRSITDICVIQAEKKGLYFRVELDPRLPGDVKGDTKLLSKILLNLIGNAIKFTEKGGIFFKISCEIRVIRFQVADTGVGIPKEIMSEIFTPFFHYSHNENQNGTGLGLAISKKLAGIMNSQLFVESKPGRGSVFRFDIDLPEVNSTPYSPYEITEKKQDADHRVDFSKKKALIVDDVRENRAVLRDILIPEGFETTEAVDGEDAIEKSLKQNFDVILMDLMMPGMDGYQAAIIMRETDRLKDVVLIAISARASITTHEACLAAGYDDYVTKPFDVEYLLDKLRRHLKIR